MQVSPFRFYWPNTLQKLEASLLTVLRGYDTFAYLSSNGFYQKTCAHTPPIYSGYQLVVGAGCQKAFYPQSENSIEELKTWLDANQSWYFGHFSYDLKNELEVLSSQNDDHHGFPDIYGFIPEWVLTLQQDEVQIYAKCYKDALALWNDLTCLPGSSEAADQPVHVEPDFKADFSKAAYTERVRKLIDHIAAGDIYEVNFCQAFYASSVELDPISLYQVLMAANPTPFACLYQFGDACVISASMERFLYKHQNKVVSQPIKGTIKRGQNAQEDRELMAKLRADEKERAENVMIVDLVRNDLAKNAKPGTVRVDELFGIYPFPTVHQMISTISATLNEGAHPIDAIKSAFPMGSMTGAPKVRAMELIEYYEAFKRGIFSGAIGYVTPWQDFDFNVVIRSFLYNRLTKQLSLPVGSAITYDANPEQEYEECLLKIEKLKSCLKTYPAPLRKAF